mgnify:CR=1 FL=1
MQYFRSFASRFFRDYVVFMRHLVCVLKRDRSYSLIGGNVIMVGMIIAVCVLSVLFLTMAATVFCELPRNARDVFCFLVILAVSVSIVLVL